MPGLTGLELQRVLSQLADEREMAAVHGDGNEGA